jgi:hypothetical protein
MYIVRFNKEALRINICNLYLSLELTSPVYCSNSTCHVFPTRQTYFGTASASFGITSNQKIIKGALLYKLWRKCATKTDNHLNSSTVVWDIGDGDHKLCACLLDFTDDFTWDEDKLWALCHQYNDQFYENFDYVPCRWLIHGSTVIKVKCNIAYESDYKLNVVIHEGTGGYTMNKPVKIDPKRLVLPLSMLIVLMHTASLSIQQSFKLNIHNLCLNVSLVSPVTYNGDGIECHRAPDYKVYAGNTMRSAFIIKKSDDTSYGVLIYRLQRRQSHDSTEISKDTSSATHLLVVWRISESNKLYANVLLIEHTKVFTWNEDSLNKLYHNNHSRLKVYTDAISDTWLMNNNMTLKMTSSTRVLKGNCELSISISEEKDDYAIRSLCLDLER